MKLYDIAEKRYEFRDDGHPDGWNDHVATSDGRVVVDIQNVNKYFKSLGNKRWDTRDVPNGLPPWPRAWFEFKPTPTDVEALLTETRLTEYGFRTYALGITGRFKPKPVTVPTFSFVWDCGPDGKILATSKIATPTRFRDNMGDPADIAEGSWGNQIMQNVMIVMLAISFTHAKNVRTVDVEPPAKVAAKRRKAGKPVGVTYKTLVIDGMKEVLRTEGGVERNGLKKALHICRGHFATYTADKPLFGKVTGTFWKPMHTRGSKARGEVKKDYKVTASE